MSPLKGRPTKNSGGLLSVAAGFGGDYDFALGVAGCEIAESFGDGAQGVASIYCGDKFAGFE